MFLKCAIFGKIVSQKKWKLCWKVGRKKICPTLNKLAPAPMVVWLEIWHRVSLTYANVHANADR